MAWQFDNDKAMYLQIAQYIKHTVLSGAYPPGSQIPTVRQLAMEAAVNPNTIQRAFLQLESEGLIISRGTLGRFVTTDTTVIEQCREKMTRQYVTQFLQSIQNLSVTTDQAIAIIREVSHEHTGM